MARVVLPGVPHHITQRGVRRLKVFRDEEDYRFYMRLLLRYARHYRLGIAAYCLMPNHIHLIGVPEHKDSLGNALQVCHSLYVQKFNEKYEKRGHLWEERPWSCPMDESYSWAAVRYVERNPVAAKMVARVEDYPWGSAPARCGLKTDPLLTSEWPPTTMIGDWSAWLGGPPDIEIERQIRKSTFTGRPCGSDEFMKHAEAVVGRLLTPQKPGPKPTASEKETTPLLWEE